jgi:hypothetical protein
MHNNPHTPDTNTQTCTHAHHRPTSSGLPIDSVPTSQRLRCCAPRTPRMLRTTTIRIQPRRRSSPTAMQLEPYGFALWGSNGLPMPSIAPLRLPQQGDCGTLLTPPQHSVLQATTGTSRCVVDYLRWGFSEAHTSRVRAGVTGIPIKESDRFAPFPRSWRTQNSAESKVETDRSFEVRY